MGRFASMAGPKLVKPESQVEQIRYYRRNLVPEAIIGGVISGVLGGVLGGNCYFNDCGYVNGPYYGSDGYYGGGYVGGGGRGGGICGSGVRVSHAGAPVPDRDPARLDQPNQPNGPHSGFLKDDFLNRSVCGSHVALAKARADIS